MKADEMELSLELSIGGCYTKSSRNQENDINESNTSSRSSASESYVVGCVQDEIFSSDSADPFKKREIQALRRREAIKKREEKQKRWATRGRGGGGGGVNERIQLEMQQNHARVVDRERRENESCEELLMKMDNRNNNGARKDIPLGQPKCFKVVENGNNCRNLDLEQGNGNGNGLIERSSSAFLDYQTTTSQKESSSTETGSPSNYSRGGRHHQQLNATAPTDDPEKSDLNGHSSRDRSDQANGNTASLLLQMTSSNIPTPECAMLAEQRSSTSRQCNKPVIKPMTPQGDKKDTAALPRMPLVSTTGNGPNGTTVNGLLYSYSKSEVSIVCVCHGTSFSPAEFVEHAGGVDISHPLKHITIVPTHFG